MTWSKFDYLLFQGLKILTESRVLGNGSEATVIRDKIREYYTKISPVEYNPNEIVWNFEIDDCMNTISRSAGRKVDVSDIREVSQVLQSRGDIQ